MFPEHLYGNVVSYKIRIEFVTCISLSFTISFVGWEEKIFSKMRSALVWPRNVTTTFISDQGTGQTLLKKNY